MNILPKKRWHVRTKENIARVRRDEAKAADEDRQRQQRARLADSEHRLRSLQERARCKYDGRGPTSPQPSSASATAAAAAPEPLGQHVNLFSNLEAGYIDFRQTNKEHEREQREEREKYEKQIGYLTYLGQDTHEALGTRSWYVEPPDRSRSTEEVGTAAKLLHDPLSVMDKYLGTKKASGAADTSSKSDQLHDKFVKETEAPAADFIEFSETPGAKKRKRSCSESSNSRSHGKKSRRDRKKCKRRHKRRGRSSSSERSDPEPVKLGKLQALRQQRLQRERQERARADALLAELRGDPLPPPPAPLATGRQKYNSQYNPDLAKQNYEDCNRRK